MADELVDRIYEAAFVPEKWLALLETLAAGAGSASAGILVFDGERPIGALATDLTRDMFEEFATTDLWRKSERIRHFHANPISGFVHADNYFPQAMQAADVATRRMLSLGVGWQAGTIIPLPTSELVVFTFERYLEDGPHSNETMARWEPLRPHLARSGLIAARLRLERAQGTAATLQAMGLPAAVLNHGGRTLAVNSLLEAMPDLFVPLAHGGLALADAAAQPLFADALKLSMTGAPAVMSLPVAASERHPACIVHVLPLRRAALDIFSQAELLITATMPSASTMVPAPQILHGLFDLTPAESRLAAALAAGHSLREAAISHGNQFSTARSQLEAIFRKTGTHKQSQLVALLQSAASLKRDH